MRKIRVYDEDGRTLKIYEVTNPFQVVVIDNKFKYWEWML